MFNIVGTGLLSTLKADSSTQDWIGFQVSHTKLLPLPIFHIAIFQLLIGIGGGILYASTTFAILAPLPVSRNASALALFAFLRTFAGTYGVAVGSSVLQTELGRRLPAEFSAQFPGGSEIAFSTIPFISGLGEPLRGQVREAFAGSLEVLWQVMIGVSGMGLISTALMKEVPMNTETDEKWAIEHAKDGKADAAEKA